VTLVDKVIDGVVEGLETVPEKPFAATTDTDVTDPTDPLAAAVI
jgi:hypothetical protein